MQVTEETVTPLTPEAVTEEVTRTEALDEMTEETIDEEETSEILVERVTAPETQAETQEEILAEILAGTATELLERTESRSHTIHAVQGAGVNLDVAHDV